MASRSLIRAGLLTYKRLHPQQLRTLVEVALAGSQAGAARKLGVSQPTVWEQLHALERHFEIPLLKVTGRVCTLTASGERLVQMALPLLEEFDSLKQRLAERSRLQRGTLRIVASPRVVQEDLAPCLPLFERQNPDLMVSCVECDDDLVVCEILEHRADIGWTPSVPNSEQSRYLDIVSSYDVDNYLITPPDHPLARRRTVRPEDVLEYRVLNGHGTFYGPRMQAIETQIDASPANRNRVAGYYVFTIRMLVKLGLGVAIVPRRASREPDPQLHERNMSAYLGRSSINAIQRRGAQHSLIAEFCQFVYERMSAGDGATSRAQKKSPKGRRRARHGPRSRTS